VGSQASVPLLVVVALTPGSNNHLSNGCASFEVVLSITPCAGNLEHPAQAQLREESRSSPSRVGLEGSERPGGLRSVNEQ
jgi:hypothetical protein